MPSDPSLYSINLIETWTNMNYIFRDKRMQSAQPIDARGSSSLIAY